MPLFQECKFQAAELTLDGGKENQGVPVAREGVTQAELHFRKMHPVTVLGNHGKSEGLELRRPLGPTKKAQGFCQPELTPHCGSKIHEGNYW